MNYTNLKAILKDYVEDDGTDYDTRVDDIIDFAEIRIMREADLTICRKQTNLSLSASTATVAAPSDIVVPRWARIQNSSYLLLKDESFIREYTPASTTTGTVKYYALDQAGTNFIFAPTPSANATVELGYTYRITGLGTGNATNWIGDNAPDVLLYACLLESANFKAMPPEDYARYNSLYTRALQSLANEEHARRRSDEYRRDEFRSPTPGPVTSQAS